MYYSKTHRMKTTTTTHHHWGARHIFVLFRVIPAAAAATLCVVVVSIFFVFVFGLVVGISAVLWKIKTYCHRPHFFFLAPGPKFLRLFHLSVYSKRNFFFYTLNIPFNTCVYAVWLLWPIFLLSNSIKISNTSTFLP